MALSLLGVFVIVIFLFCVFTWVVYALRGDSNASGFFIRGFTSQDAKPNADNRGQVEFVNRRKGFFRLTLVLSVLFSILAGIVNAEPRNHHSVDRFVISFFIVFGLTWLVYLMISYVLRGFASRLTLVLSVLFSILAGIVNAGLHNHPSVEVFLPAFFIVFGLTWLVYFMVGFVIRGFASKK